MTSLAETGAPPSASAVAAPPSRQVMVFEPGDGRLVRRPDRLAVEEPLEIRLSGPDGATTFGVTMRTPGSDMELVAGLLLSEGLVDGIEDLARIAYCVGERGDDGAQRYNVVTAVLRRPVRDSGRERRTTTSTSCGVCGTASIEALRDGGHPPVRPGPTVALEWLCQLPYAMRDRQRSFDDTGTVHAAGLAEAGGSLLVVREDVGRHNAVDKAVGWAMQAGRLAGAPLALVVSGRVSFEIVQKALRAGINMVVAVSGATSLAVSLADDRGITLVGFARGGRCTVYSGPERLRAV